MGNDIAPLLIPNVLSAEQVLLAVPQRQLLAESGLRCLVVAPLAGAQARIGTMLLFDDQPGRVTAEQLPFVDRFASRAARAAEEQRLRDALVEGRAISQERNVLRATLDASQDAVLIFDADLQPRVSNHRFDEWFGVSADELQWFSVVDALERALAQVEQPVEVRFWFLTILSDPTSTASRKIRFLAGPVTEVECYSAPVLGADGSTFGRVFAFHDFSREAELARTKDEIVSVVSHELRTPLASLVGFAELLMTRDYSPADRQRFLGVMVQEGRRLATLVNDFLDLQRLESGRQKVALVPLDILQQMEQARAAAGDDPNAPIVLTVPDDVPLVLWDANALQQVLQNLISNARKYPPDGGTVRVSARAGQGLVTIAIADSGLGIPRDALPQLFEKFYRVDNSDRREILGTGLGLAISKRIVESHGGRIWAESDGPGRGSTFRFTLPAVPIPREVLSVAPGEPADVLVVEDDATFASWMAETLRAEGYGVRAVASAEEALAQIEHERPRVILLDLHLASSMDGWDLLAVLRGRPQTHDIPVVVVSAYGERGRGEMLGTADYLLKPVRKERLMATLRNLSLGPSLDVLVVEDEPATRQLILHTLERAGHRARGVGSGEEALSLLEESPDAFGLLTLDLGLPGTDGFAVLKALRERPATQDLPVVIVTARELDAGEARYLNERARDIVRKSNGIPLGEAVSRALAASSPAPGACC